MNFQQLRHFVVTAQAGNIVRAAQTLYISQSGLSRSIGALEHQIGLPLFERSPKGVTLTEFGRSFLPGAKLLLNEHRRHVEELKAFREMRAGSLAIGINHSFAYIVMPEALTELLTRWPSVSISVMTDSYPNLLDGLVTGDLDLVLALYTDASKREELQYEILRDLRMVAFARPGHPLLDGRPIDLDALVAANWALVRGASAQAAFSGLFESAGVKTPRVSLQCASVALLASVIATTDLLGVLPESLINAPLIPELVRVPIADMFTTAHVGLIRRQEAAALPIAEKLAIEIRRRFDTLQDTHSDPTEDH